MRHVIDILDLSTKEIDELLCVAEDIIENPEKYREKCKYKKLATLFFEPSTRTRLSFEAAMMELGGNVIGFSDANSSSSAKGESVSDTIRVVGCYADIIAMRHPKEGAPYAASFKTEVPIINAGDGGHNHPTQTLADLLTIKREKGRVDNLTETVLSSKATVDAIEKSTTDLRTMSKRSMIECLEILNSLNYFIAKF